MTRRVFNPDWRVPPGEIVQEALDDRGLGVEDLVRAFGGPDPGVYQVARGLLDGREPITEPIAVALQELLGISVAFWLNLEAAYQRPRR